MSTSEDVRTISKLTRETLENKIAWKIIAPDPTKIENEIIGNVYATTVLNKPFRLYKFKWRSFLNEVTFEDYQDYRLELIGSNGLSLFIFSNSSNAIGNLYSLVQLKTSQIEEFYKNYLGDEKPKADSADPF